jgi:tryptophan synthase alpha chain
MNRIDKIFADLRKEGRRALMPFLTAGDPDLKTTAALLPALEAAGASVCELGIPFSDPIADGPVIQASMTHALAGGVRPADVLEMVSKVRGKLDMGLVAMVSYSIVYRLGGGNFLRDAAEAGIDGFIVPDLPLEQCTDTAAAAANHGLVCSMLVAPTTPQDRSERIVKASSGFVYLLARSGLTGERTELPPQLRGRIERLQAVTSLPIAVGFGVSNREQVRQVVKLADAAIVGSAIMRRVDDLRAQSLSARVEGVRSFVTDLSAGL